MSLSPLLPAADAVPHAETDDAGPAAVDFSIPADVFWSASARRLTRQGSMRFRSFETLAEAIRFVVGDKSEQRFRCAVDTADDRYEDEAIEALYNRRDFPAAGAGGEPAPAPAKTGAAYGLRHEDRGTWTVYEIRTGDAVIVDGTLMTRMGEADAARMAAALNGPGGHDKLATGP